MEGDARYVDITPQLQMTGATWEDIVAFMNLRSMHPLKPTLKSYLGHVNSETDALLRKIPGDIVIYGMRDDIPLMLVHVGVLDTLVKMFHMTTYDADRVRIKVLHDIARGTSKLAQSTTGLSITKLASLCQESIDICVTSAEKLEEVARNERRSYFFQQLEKVELITNILRTELEMQETMTNAELSE